MSVRFASDTVSPIHPEFIISAWNSEQKRNFMLEQIRLIAEKRNWFESHNLFCTLNLIDELHEAGNDSNLLIVSYVQIMPDDFVMQLHRF